MCAAWIGSICPGIALAFDSWPLVGRATLLHPVWHGLVPYENDAAKILRRLRRIRATNRAVSAQAREVSGLLSRE